MNKEKLCAFCNQPFVPRSYYQRYCKRPHYMTCPVCGKDYLVTNNENLKRPPVACSYACRAKKMKATNLERYGVTVGANSEQGKKKTEQTIMNKYGVKYALQAEEVKSKSKKTMLSRYGADHPMHSEQIKNKLAATNIERFGTTTFLTSEEGKKQYKEIMMNKYGVSHPIQNEGIKHKITETNRKRYGSSWFPASDIGKEKIKTTVHDRYGVDYVTQLKSTMDKTKQTSLTKYGVSNPAKSKYIKQKIKNAILNKYGVQEILSVPEIREKIMKTTMERYGVPFYIMKPEVQLSSGAISKLNLEFASKLSDRNIKYEMEFRINNKSYDLMLPELNMLLELNPTYTHNLLGNHWNLDGLPCSYHKEKVQLAHENRFSIRCLFDWDNENEMLAELAAPKLTVNSKDCTLYKLNNKVGIEFLSRCGRSRTKHYPKKLMIIGAVYNDQLIAAIAVSTNKNDEFKQFSYTIIDYGQEWGMSIPGVFKMILKTINEFIDYDDIILRIDSDRIYLNDIEELCLFRLGWSIPSVFWSKKNIHIPYSNNELKRNNLIEDGWLPIEDCGSLIFNIEKTALW